jgi:hypothetical protein
VNMNPQLTQYRKPPTAQLIGLGTEVVENPCLQSGSEF